MKYLTTLFTAVVFLGTVQPAIAASTAEKVAADYDSHLGALWDHFHRNPELSLMEF